MKNTPRQPQEPTQGPAPAGDPRSVSDAQRRVLQAVAGGCSTAAQVAEVTGLHGNMARRHLGALVERGLVSVSTEPATGRGRPSRVHSITVVGLTALAADDSSEEYRTLTAAFAEHLAAHSSAPSEEALAIGRTWGAILAGRQEASTEPVETQVLALLERLRFSPQREQDVIALRTCPLLEAAKEHPEVVCQVHLGLVQGASGAYGGSGTGGRLEPFAAPGACHLHLG